MRLVLTNVGGEYRSIEFAFMEGCYVWEIDYGLENQWVALFPVFKPGDSPLVRFKGFMSWVILPFVRPVVIYTQMPKSMNIAIPPLSKDSPKMGNFAFQANNGLTLATRLMLGSGGTGNLDLAFFKASGKSYIDILILAADGRLSVTGLIRGNFFLNLGLIQVAISDAKLSLIYDHESQEKGMH